LCYLAVTMQEKKNKILTNKTYQLQEFQPKFQQY
jgi:hypothetical protein